MAGETIKLTLTMTGVELGPVVDGKQDLRLRTDDGTILCRYHPALKGSAAVLWVFGAGGGLNGPAAGLYPRLAGYLAADHIASLELSYRRPGKFADCVLDTLVGSSYLEDQGRSRIALVGHSFGGAVVINAGLASPSVGAVAALSTQSGGTELVHNLSPRPLLLMHGTDDEVLPDSCSRDVYQRARDPKQLVLYPECRHGLDECREEVDRDLLRWLREKLAEPGESAPRIK
jgi:hypothetical protein